MRLSAVRFAICCLLLVACGDDGAVRSGDLNLLSSRGLYSDIASRKVVKEAFEYRPDYGLWSDGADKRRWIVLPADTKIDSSDMAHWVFPLGTKFFKEFSHDGKKLETRLIERVKETGFRKNDYFMATFIWRADQSDAELTADGKDNVLGTEHDVPKQKQCVLCHQGEPGAILGFSAVQLSASGTLAKVEKRGWFSDAPGRTFEIPGDEIEKPALGVMHANCGHCHSDTGMADFMHLRILPDEVDREVEELEAYRTTVGRKLSDEWKDHPERFTTRIVPGDPEASSITYRMGTRGDDKLVPDQMPPLASRKVDEEGLAAVTRWIESLDGVVIEDGGVADGGEHDAAVEDAGERDAGERDAGEPDAGEPGRDGQAGRAGDLAGQGGDQAGRGGPTGVNAPSGENANPPDLQPAAAGSGASDANAGSAADAAAGGAGSGVAGTAAGGAESGAAGAGAADGGGAGSESSTSGGEGTTGESSSAGGSGASGMPMTSPEADDAGMPGGEPQGPDRDVNPDAAVDHDAHVDEGTAQAPADTDTSSDESADHDAHADEGVAPTDTDTSSDESAEHDAHADEGAPRDGDMHSDESEGQATANDRDAACDAGSSTQ